jgi:hypothetical protein
VPHTARPGATRAAGDLLGTGLGAVMFLGSRVRGARALHPRGRVLDGVVTVRGPEGPPFGVPLLDRPAEYAALVRLSKALPSPGAAPDVLGLAVRLLGAGPGGGPVDLLYSTTPSPPVLRHVLMPVRDVTRATYSSVFPYDLGGRRGLLAAVPDRDRVPPTLADIDAAVAAGRLRFTLAAATLTGPWRPFATLELLGRPARDEDICFEVNEHVAEHLQPRGVLQRARVRAYRASQRGRRAAASSPVTLP